MFFPLVPVERSDKELVCFLSTVRSDSCRDKCMGVSMEVTASFLKVLVKSYGRDVVNAFAIESKEYQFFGWIENE